MMRKGAIAGVTLRYAAYVAATEVAGKQHGGGSLTVSNYVERKSMQSRIAFVLTAALLVAVFAAPMALAQSANAPDTLVVAVTSIGNTLDAVVANFTNVTIATNHIYDRIINFDENFDFVPGVADSWEFVDATTFKFTVADGFVFHNGQPLTLEDVVFSIERLREVPRVASIMNNIASVEITGEREITIKLVEPHSSTIRNLMPEVHVFNKAYAESNPDYANKPIGTGPYMVANFIPGDRLELVAWDDYPFEKPAIKRIVFRTIEEAASRYIAVETGEAQFAAISFHDMERAARNPNLQVISQRTTNTSFISMNTQKPPFDNRNIRLAMAYATPKVGLTSVQGGSVVIDSMTPSMFSTYYSSPNVPEFDLNKAMQLLAQEGYGPGNPLRFETWVYGGNTVVMEAFQAVLRGIGVEMSIRNLEFGVFLEGMARGEYQMLSGSWNNVTGDPLVAIENYWSGSWGSRNISFFQNDRVDELYELAKAAVDEQVIIEAAREVQEIAAAEMPIIPTYSQLAIFAMDSRLKGVQVLPSSVYSFRTAYFE